MDNSEIYRRMCEKAKEIQSNCPLPSPPHKRSFFGYGASSPPYHFLNGVWLPRQDQLQEMSGFQWDDYYLECLKIDAGTAERSGLLVVMSKRYKKVWDGGEWGHAPEG